MYLPDSERHLQTLLNPKAKRYMELPDGRPCYQGHKYQAALEVCTGRGVFVDIGAHCGLWSMQAERDFNMIYAFEPCRQYRDIYPHNMRGNDWILEHYGLSDKAEHVTFIHEPNSSGGTHCKPDSCGEGELRVLDDVGLVNVDLMKIDVEGYELKVLRGATNTIKTHKPVIVIEQKGRDLSNYARPKHEAVQYLRGLGMRELRTPLSGDHFMGW